MALCLESSLISACRNPPPDGLSDLNVPRLQALSIPAFAWGGPHMPARLEVAR